MIGSIKPTPLLRWIQLGYTALIIPGLLFISFMDIFIIEFESGKSIGIPGRFGPFGDAINVATFFLVVAQVIGFWRLSSLNIIFYAWFGSWFALFAFGGLYSTQVFDDTFNNVAILGQQILDILHVDYQINSVTVEVGQAWTYLMVAGLSMLAMAIWMYVQKFNSVRSSSPVTVANQIEVAPVTTSAFDF